MAEAKTDSRFDPPVSFWLILMGLFLATLILLWLGFHTHISHALLAWKGYELAWIAAINTSFEGLHDEVARLRPENVTPALLWKLFTLVGISVSRPAAGALILLSALVFLCAPDKRFRKKLDMLGVFRAQGAPFRCASSFDGRRQEMVGPRRGEPRANDFALHDPEWIRSYAWGPATGFREDMCRRELARQLGAVWLGVGRAAPHVRCLFAAFALQAARRRGEAIDFLGDLAEDLPKTDDPAVPAHLVAQADHILSDAALVEPCVEVAGKHAFEAPAMISVLRYARERSGVLAPGQFNWLKLVDRRLWYALHSLGMPNPYVEARGSRDHWDAELLAGVPLFSPSVDRAAASIRARAGEVPDLIAKEP